MTTQLTSNPGAANHAVTPSMPIRHLSSGDRTLLARLNRCWNDDIVRHRAEVLEIYASLIRHIDNSTIDVSPDLAYGADVRQKLDVFVPRGSSQRRVLVFVHGGAFTRGSNFTTMSPIGLRIRALLSSTWNIGSRPQRSFRPARRMSDARLDGWSRTSPVTAAIPAMSC